MFRGLNPTQAPQGLQMNWQPNIGGEGQSDSGQGMAGLVSAADMLQQWLASRRRGIALPHSNGPDMHTGGGMQPPSHEV